MTKLRLKLAAFGDEENLIIETVDGVPEIRREEAPVASRDRSLSLSLGEDPPGHDLDILTIAVEECP